VTLSFGGELVLNQCFYHLYFLTNPLSISRMLSKHGCFWKKQRLKLFFTIFESLETFDVFFVFLTFCWKFQSFRCFVFLAFFYSQSWHSFLMLEILRSWMAITFTHGRWRWNFSYMIIICGRSPQENYCRHKLNLEILFLK